VKWWEQKLAAVESESIDAEWAERTRREIQDAIPTMGISASFVEANCRTTRCTLKVEWPKYSTALEEQRKLIHSSAMSNCERALMLPPPEHVEDKYLATIVYDCIRT
jgi:hypothetical protein